MKKHIIPIGLILVSLFTVIVEADDTLSNLTNSNTSVISTLDTNETLPLNETELPANQTNNETQGPFTDYEMVAILPREFKVGETTLNIQIKNTGTTVLNNLMAFVSGKGFASYDVTPIDLLRPGEKSYIVVSGTFEKEGNVTLTIWVQDKSFYYNVTVMDPDALAREQQLNQLEYAQERARASIAVISAQLADLINNYTQLENDLERKRSSSYDVSNVNLEDLKKFVRNTQSSLVRGDAQEANASFTVTLNEYNDQKSKLDKAPFVKKTLLMKIKDQAVLISTLSGAVIASFTLYELLKKKKDALYRKVKELKIDKSTKITVEKKDEPKPKKGKKKKK